MQKIAKDIYVETGFTGVTVGAIVTSEGIICIDTPTDPADARRWRLKLAQLSDKPIQFVINLDHHRDRVLGNVWFEAPVIAHELTSERVRTLPEVFKGAASETGADSDLVSDLAGVRVVAPQLTFAERLTLIKGEHEVHLIHRPGSAAGAIWVEVPEQKVAFTGDAITKGVPPLLHDGDLDLWLDTLAEIPKKRFLAKTLVPGRGAPLDKKGLKPMQDFLRLVRRKVKHILRTNKTRADAAAQAESLLEPFSVPSALREHYARRLRTGVEHIYDMLAAGGER